MSQKTFFQRVRFYPGYHAHALFTTVFWALNTVEKLVPGFGKPRFQQIATYLAHVGVGNQWVTPTLVFFGAIEGTAAFVAVLALMRGPGRGYLSASLVISLMLMTLFVFGDICAGDRQQLQTHTIYATMFLLQLYGLVQAASTWTKEI